MSTTVPAPTKSFSTMGKAYTVVADNLADLLVGTRPQTPILPGQLLEFPTASPDNKLVRAIVDILRDGKDPTSDDYAGVLATCAELRDALEELARQRRMGRQHLCQNLFVNVLADYEAGIVRQQRITRDLAYNDKVDRLVRRGITIHTAQAMLRESSSLEVCDHSLTWARYLLSFMDEKRLRGLRSSLKSNLGNRPSSPVVLRSVVKLYDDTELVAHDSYLVVFLRCANLALGCKQLRERVQAKLQEYYQAKASP